MGLYLVFKLGDMMVRGTYVYLFEGTYQTNAFLVEILFGVLLPFVLVLFKKVRGSAGRLFLASTVFVLGVLLNRINVFLVSYAPPYKITAYFPALGEIFITIGLIATLMFLYRAFVFIFPVLGTHGAKWPATSLMVLILSVSVFHSDRVRAEEIINYSKMKTARFFTRLRPTVADAPTKPRILNSPVLNRYSDLYEPVSFKHRKHLKVIKDKDCTVCHHRQPRGKGDIYGEPVKITDLQRMQKLPVRCSTCHELPFNPRQIHVPGLKGAYHQLCLDCHRKSERPLPVSKPVLSKAAVQGPTIPAPKQRPLADCLTCHAKKGTVEKSLAGLK